MSVDIKTACDVVVKKLNKGEKFCVKDLFPGYEWNREKKGKRMNLGILFLNEVESGTLSSQVDKLAKNSANQQVYIKK